MKKRKILKVGKLPAKVVKQSRAAKMRPLHERRGVTFQELGALLAVRELLKMGELTHVVGRCSDMSFERMSQGEHLFNMCDTGRESGCGSIGCIGGTMAMIMGLHDTTSSYVCGPRHSSKLHDLFFPSNAIWWPEITAAHAVEAIDNWLQTGNPGWDKLGIPRRD